MRSELHALSLLLAVVAFASCKNTQLNQTPSPEARMFKVSILYPNGEGKTFDMDYYEKKHMPMVAGFIGKNLKFYEIDKGIAGRTPTEKVPFLAIGSFFIADVAEYNKALAPKRDTIIGDFKNYTNVQPVIQISEVKHVR